LAALLQGEKVGREAELGSFGQIVVGLVTLAFWRLQSGPAIRVRFVIRNVLERGVVGSGALDGLVDSSLKIRGTSSAFMGNFIDMTTWNQCYAPKRVL